MANSPRKSRQSAGSNGSPTEDTDSKDAEQLLRADHRSVEKLFREFEDESADEQKKQELARRACNELIAHARLEEELFYPACREKEVGGNLLDEAQVEHDTLKLLIGDLKECAPGSPYFDAKVKVLSEYVQHHVKEEEQPFAGIFAKARTAGVDMDGLGRRLQERRQQLMKEVESGEIEMSAPRSIKDASRTSQRNLEDTSMARNFERDYDEDRGFGPESGRGRFGGRYTREQDDRTGGRQFGRRGPSRQEGSESGRYDYEYDQGRGGYRRQGGFEDERGGYERGGYDRGGDRDRYGSEFESGRGRWGGGYREGNDEPRGARQGYGSFERESDDYRRGLGGRDRMGGGRSDRDEDYRDLGRSSRFAGRGDDDRRFRDDDDFDYMSGRGRSGGWRDRY